MLPVAESGSAFKLWSTLLELLRERKMLLCPVLRVALFCQVWALCLVIASSDLNVDDDDVSASLFHSLTRRRGLIASDLEGVRPANHLVSADLQFPLGLSTRRLTTTFVNLTTGAPAQARDQSEGVVGQLSATRRRERAEGQESEAG